MDDDWDNFAGPIDPARVARLHARQTRRLHARQTRRDDDPAAKSKEPSKPLLRFVPIRLLAKEVDDAGPRRWLLRGLWPGRDYGVLAAEMKAGKTWLAVAVAVAVASGEPFLHSIPVDDPGIVLMFAGEGGEANLVRRFRAVCAEYGVIAEDLPIVFCCRAPQLSSDDHLEQFRDQVVRLKPKLVILDPFYLSAGGADGASLYAMGAILEKPQSICQDAGSALLVVTHFNRGNGSGALRISGAGPAEWGRVLMTVTVSKHGRRDPGEAHLEVQVIGGEIPTQTLRVYRRIWSDPPEDLNAPLNIIMYVEPGEPEPDTDEPKPRRRGMQAKVIDVLGGATEPLTIEAIQGAIKRMFDTTLPARETVHRALTTLRKEGIAVVDGQQGKAQRWRLTAAVVQSASSAI